MLDVMVTCVRHHNNFYHIRKWHLHVWNFMALGDLYVLRFRGLIRNGYVYSTVAPSFQLPSLSSIYVFLIHLNSYFQNDVRWLHLL